MKKKASKKKVSRKVVKPAPISCATCVFAGNSLSMTYKTDFYNCHRYPQSSRASDNHWCGEHKRR